jgi:hypothetical protein
VRVEQRCSAHVGFAARTYVAMTFAKYLDHYFAGVINCTLPRPLLLVLWDAVSYRKATGLHLTGLTLIQATSCYTSPRRRCMRTQQGVWRCSPLPSRRSWLTCLCAHR